MVAFVASPIQETEKELQTLGVRMKKNKVAIDVVSFGEDSENTTKLQTLVNAANSGDNSHYLPVATKPYVILTDELAGSSIFGASMAMGGSAMEDDLELAIRLSLQEQGGGGAGGAPAAEGANAAIPAPAAPAGNAMAVDEDEQMRQAIAMSMGVAPEDIDEDMALAIRMSMQDNQDNNQMDVDQPESAPQSAPATASTTTTEAKPSTELSKPEEEKIDSELIQSLVQNLEGVDPNDPNFKELMAALNPDAAQNKDDKKPENK